MTPALIIPDDSAAGLEASAQLVTPAELKAWISQFTATEGAHLALRYVVLPDGRTRRIYLDNSCAPAAINNQGRVRAYETLHATDEAQHTCSLVPVT